MKMPGQCRINCSHDSSCELPLALLDLKSPKSQCARDGSLEKIESAKQESRKLQKSGCNLETQTKKQANKPQKLRRKHKDKWVTFALRPPSHEINALDAASAPGILIGQRQCPHLHAVTLTTRSTLFWQRGA